MILSKELVFMKELQQLKEKTDRFSFTSITAELNKYVSQEVEVYDSQEKQVWRYQLIEQNSGMYQQLPKAQITHVPAIIRSSKNYAVSDVA